MYVQAIHRCVCFFCGQLGLKETHWLCGAEEPRSHVLHELAAADLVLHQQAEEGRVPDAHRGGRRVQECAFSAAASLL